MKIQDGLSVSSWSMIKSFNMSERFKLGRALLRLVMSPARTEEVFRLAEPFLENDARQGGALAEYLQAVLELQGVGEAFRDRYAPPMPDLNELQKRPEGSLGRLFAEHMISRGLSVNFYPPVEVTSTLTWIEQRARQQHDILHVVAGFDTDLAGELGVQAFMLAQLNTPLAGTLIGGGLLNASLFHPNQLYPCLMAITRGFQAGLGARPVLGYRFEEHWDRPLASVRADLALAVSA